MHIHPVELNFPLPQDRCIDIFLLQWRTPVVSEEGNDPAVLETSSVRKRVVLERFADFLRNNAEDLTRPLFIIAPELSTPISEVELLQQIVEQSPQPTVIIAGLEYLSPDAYRQLVESSNNDPPTPWLDRIDQQEQVNAALILSRDADGNRRTHIQPKLHPADPEQIALVHAAENVLLFRHQDQRSGRGLNFCVQICSDFCNARSVSLLRESIAGAFPDDLRLDMTFLLQYNPRQDVPQFRDGTNAYFDVADGKVDTGRGALLLVNNSSLEPSKSMFWGESQFRFPYNRWRQYGGEFTYRIDQVSSELWQAITLREPGPTVYWLTYKPAYLNSPRPGSGEVRPFEIARHWPIRHHAELGDIGQVTFSHIPAVAHWLQGEWTESLVEMKQTAAAAILRGHGRGERAGESRRGVVLQAHSNSCSDSVHDWCQLLTADGRKAEKAVHTYFWAFAGADGYPYAKDDFRSREPACWCTDATQAVKEWMRVHALLRLGAETVEGCRLEISVDLGAHALLADSLKVAYLWGGNQKSAASMVEAYRAKMPQADRVSSNVLLVLNAPGTRPEKSRLVNRSKPINEGEPPLGAGSHLRPAGSVTRGEGWELKIMYDHELNNALDDNDLETFQASLREAVRAVIN